LVVFSLHCKPWVRPIIQSTSPADEMVDDQAR